MAEAIRAVEIKGVAEEMVCDRFSDEGWVRTPARVRLLLTTGRVSSEMLLKAAKMQVPVVVSRHSPTSAAISLARDLGIALAGHARGNRLSVYSHPERLGCTRIQQGKPDAGI